MSIELERLAIRILMEKHMKKTETLANPFEFDLPLRYLTRLSEYAMVLHNLALKKNFYRH